MRSDAIEAREKSEKSEKSVKSVKEGRDTPANQERGSKRAQ